MFPVRLEGQQYVIKSYNMSHNHRCTGSWMVCDPLSKRLSSEEKENLKPVILHCQSTDEVIESIKERTGKQVTAADVKNMKAELSTGWTRKQVLQMMRQNGEVREHAENGCITAICFSSYDQIRLYSQYPEVVCIDSTYKTNNKKYSLFQLVVTDSWGRGRTVMFAWTQKEKRADVTWVLDKFKEIMGNTTKTETFVMDFARSESAAVRITHGHANIILCAFHYEVDVSICECNCSTFNMCRYPCRHLLLAYIKRRSLTAHQLLRCCCRWKLDNTHNLQNNTGISLPRRSKEYIQLQRLLRMCKQQIVEKYGERFANQVERKVYNFYLRIINS
ncbi:unnamed protein product [Schistosoma guineensis]|nr:unnamed protein product [Schistosoma guineensis]